MAGHTVDVVPNGLHALGRLDAAMRPDVVLADVMMPGLDGLATLAQIRDRHPSLAVILVTGQQLDPAQKAEADAVFAKPIEFDLLLEEIERLT